MELLIEELDRLIRRKSANRLLQRYPSIFLPGTLSTAVHEIERHRSETFSSVADSFNSERFRQNQTQRLLLAFFLAVLGVAAIVVVRPILGRYFDTHFEESRSATRYLWAFLANVSSLVIPLVGVLALATIVPALGIQTRLVDFAGRFVFQVLMLVVVANWLGHTVFSPNAPGRRLVGLDDKKAQLGLRLCQGLGIAAAIELFVEALATGLIREQATISLLAVPILTSVAILLWYLARLLNGAIEKAETKEQSDAASSAGSGIIRFLVFLLRVTALVTVPLVLVGYVPLARHVSDATVMTVAILGIALFIYTLLVGAIRAIVSRGRKSDDTDLPLLPFTIGSLLFLALLPLVAIVWGAKPSDVAEVWRLVTVGTQIGEVHLSLGVVFSLLIVFAIGAGATRWLQHALRDTVLPRTKMDSGARNALVTGVGYVGLTLSVMFAVTAAGLSFASLAVVAGALSLGIGFGLQTIVSNFVSGIILLVERPIAEGDWIEVGGHSGIVKKIAVRSTQITTFDRHDVIVPNQDLIAGTVKNMTRSSKVGRLIIPVGVAYGSNLKETRAVLEAAASENESLLTYPKPMVVFRGLGDSSLDFELRCFLKDVNTLVTSQSDLLFAIYDGLNEAGIEIPFPQRDIHIKNVSD